MITRNFSMNVSAIGTDDGKNTYEIRRKWSEKGKKAIVIELYPTIEVENCGMMDVSTMHLLNHVNDFGWGELRIMNLYATVVANKPSVSQLNCNKAVVKKGEARLKQIKRITKNYSDDEIEKIYTSMNKARQLLVTPIEPTWDQLLTKWYEEEYQGKEFKEGTPLILTEKGERVRSKSEKILADYFYRKNILYKYEKPLHLKGYGTVYPDFTFLSRKTYREIYWEHEGMMDKQDYARAAVRKIESYQINHIYPGERLIITFETEQNILNSKIIENLIEKYLL